MDQDLHGNQQLQQLALKVSAHVAPRALVDVPSRGPFAEPTAYLVGSREESATGIQGIGQ